MHSLMSFVVFVTGLAVSVSYIGGAAQNLSYGFYGTSCPSLQSVVRSSMRSAVQKEARMAASILRLFFHDCFVQGCDGSVLLDDVPATGFVGEKTAFPNNGSLRGFDVVDTIKANVELACPAVVSCADILALAARDAVVLSGGPSWSVPLGRRDSTTASYSGANANLPSPDEDVAALASKFAAQGLSITDLVTLSGAHTIGRARCISFRNRLYNFESTGAPDPTLDSTYLAQLQTLCPSSGDDDATSPLDSTTPDQFDARYFDNLINGKGLLTSDQELFSSNFSHGGTPSTATIVRSFARSTPSFFASFPRSMIAMGNLNPLTGTAGQVRANCRIVNN